MATLLRVEYLTLRALRMVNEVYDACLSPSAAAGGGFVNEDLVRQLSELNLRDFFTELSQLQEDGEELAVIGNTARQWLDLIGVDYTDILEKTALKQDQLQKNTSEHKAQSWIDHQLKNPELYPTFTENMDEKWSHSYDDIINSQFADGPFKQMVLEQMDLQEQDYFFQAENGTGFIADGIRTNPLPQKNMWGEQYHLVTVQNQANPPGTGNLPLMLKYTEDRGEKLTIAGQEAPPGKGVLPHSPQLEAHMQRMERSGKVRRRYYAPEVE